MNDYDVTKTPDNGVDVVYDKVTGTMSVTYRIGSLNFALENIDPRQMFREVHPPRVTGWLPPMVRYISADRKIVVFERPPRLQNYTFARVNKSAAENMRSTHNHDNLLSTYRLLIPWQVYVIELSDTFTPQAVWLFSRPSPLQSLDDFVYNMPLLNFYADNSLCAPVLAQIQTADINSIAQAISVVYHMIWSSGFNYDLAVAADIGLQNGFVGMIKPRMNHDSYQRFYATWESQISSLDNLHFVNPGRSRTRDTTTHHLTLRDHIAAARCTIAEPNHYMSWFNSFTSAAAIHAR